MTTEPKAGAKPKPAAKTFYVTRGNIAYDIKGIERVGGDAIDVGDASAHLLDAGVITDKKPAAESAGE